MASNITNDGTTASCFLMVIRRALEHNGVTALPVFRKARISEDIIQGKQSRILQGDIDRVLHEAVMLTKDDAFPIKLVEHTSPAANILTVLAASMDTVKTLFKISSLRYSESFTNSVYTTLDDSNDIRLIFETSAEAKDYPLYTIDFLIAYVVVFFRNLLDDPMADPIKIKLKRCVPVNLASFNKVFMCSVEFNSDVNEIHFNKGIYNLRNPLANKSVTFATKSILEEELKKVSQIPMAKRTASYINLQLPESIPNQEQWANSLHISVRNLQRQLQAEGTSFNEILKNERIKLSKMYLIDKNYTIAQISSQLNFSDSSHFSKTFKQVMGITPKDFQAMYFDNLKFLA